MGAIEPNKLRLVTEALEALLQAGESTRSD